MIFNVAAAVVDLIEAESEDEAVRIMVDRIHEAGLEVYDGEVSQVDAFLSEPVDFPVSTRPVRRIEDAPVRGDLL